MNKFLLLLLLFLTNAFLSFSQREKSIKDMEKELKPLMDLMFDAPTDNERFNANEKFIALFDEALSLEGAFSYSFPELKRISNLKSSDNKFRIFTWAVISQQKEYESFGFVQSYNDVKDNYQIYKLTDKSEEIFNPNLAKLDENSWFGAVYYELITTKYDDKTYYTLLGYDGNDIYTTRKIIEPIVFKPRSSKPEFGASWFYKDKERKRYIFEYSPTASFALRWENQYYENKAKLKDNSLLFSIEKFLNPMPDDKEKKNLEKPSYLYNQEYMIVYEVLEPLFEGMEDMPQFQVSSGVVNGLKFEKGRWRHIEGIQPRNPKPKKGQEPQRKVEGEEQILYNYN